MADVAVCRLESLPLAEERDKEPRTARAKKRASSSASGIALIRDGEWTRLVTRLGDDGN